MLVALSPWIVSAFPSTSLSPFNFVAVRIPNGSLLSPSRTAAVCGGNVLTSQRIVDVVLKAFHAAAASQGCTKWELYFYICLIIFSDYVTSATSHLGLEGRMETVKP